MFSAESAYNLVSVLRATEARKVVTFSKTGCEFSDDHDQVTAFAAKQGSLYLLEVCRKSQESVHTTTREESKERLWHRRFGHLNEQSLQRLVKRELVNKLDYDTSGSVEHLRVFGSTAYMHTFQRTAGKSLTQILESVF